MPEPARDPTDIQAGTAGPRSSHRQASQLSRSRPARNELRPILHLNLQPRRIERHHRGDVIEIDDVRPVDSQETRRIEPRLELVHPEVHEKAPAAEMDR